MKFISKLFNLLLLAFTFCFVTCTEWGVYNLTALPSGVENSIGLVSRNVSETYGSLEVQYEGYTEEDLYHGDDNIAYFDTFGFFGTDIAESVTREPRFMIRGWLSWDWWQNGMAWADKVAECVIGVVVPVFAPTYEASQIKTYYSEYRGSSEIAFYSTEDLDTPYFTKTAQGVFDLQGCSDLETFAAAHPEVEIPYVKNYMIYGKEEGHDIFFIKRVIGGKVSDKNLLSWGAESGSKAKIMHVSNIRKTYNTILKINKYNCGAYDKWVNKFLGRDVNGGFVVKQCVSALYFQFYLAIVFSIWFVYQNPIVFTQTADGSQEMKGGIHWHHRRRGEKKPKKNKDK